MAAFFLFLGLLFRKRKKNVLWSLSKSPWEHCADNEWDNNDVKIFLENTNYVLNEGLIKRHKQVK